MANSYNAPPPPDFGGYRADVEAAYQRAATKAGTDTTSTMQQYGFQGGNYDANTGTYNAPKNSDGSYKVDVSNQTGLIQRTLNSQGRGLTQQQNQYASRGLGNSGFAHAAEGQSRYDNAGAQADLANQFTQQFNAGTGALSDAFAARGQGLNQIGREEAGWNAQQEWWKSMLEPPQSSAVPSQYTQVSPDARPGTFNDSATNTSYNIFNAQNPDIIRRLGKPKNFIKFNPLR